MAEPAVDCRTLFWVTTRPAREGFYWVRFRGSTDRQVFEARAGVEYVAGDVEWAGPIPEPYEPLA